MSYGIQFRYPPRYAKGRTAPYMTHMFDMRCRENGTAHRFPKINHPWTNGQVERMNVTIKEATVKRFHYGSHQRLRQHLQNFIDAHNFAAPPQHAHGSAALRIHLQSIDYRAKAVHP